MSQLANALGILILLLLVGVAPAGLADDEPQARQGPRQRMLEAYDTDGDGVLSAEERRAARSEKWGKGTREGPKAWDTDGDGVVSDEERAAAREERRKRSEARIRKYDSDGDGRLSPSERKAARADRARMRPPRGQRGPAGGTAVQPPAPAEPTKSD